MNIFISYSSKDRAIVQQVAADLRRAGHNVWFDEELTRTGGQKWWDNILAELRQRDLVIFALSPHSVSSEACRREYNYANQLNKRILPIIIEAVKFSALPFELQEIQAVDYSQRSAGQGIALAASIQNLPPARPLPKPLPVPPQVPIKAQPQDGAGQSASQPTATRTPALRGSMIFVLVVISGIVGFVLLNNNQGSNATSGKLLTINQPHVNDVIGDERLCLDGTGNATGSNVNVQIMDANSTIIAQGVSYLGSDGIWKTTVEVPPQTPGPGSVHVYTTDNSGNLLQEQTLAISLTNRYLPAAPSLGVRPEGTCQDGDTTPLN